EAIHRASDRIAHLEGQIPSAAESARSEAGDSRWDSAMVLELFRQERYDEIEQQLSRLPERPELAPEAELFRAALAANRGDLLRVEAICSSLLELDELNAGAHYLVALCREQAGDTRSALERYQAAAYLDPSFAMPRLQLGRAARRGGDLEKARRE